MTESIESAWAKVVGDTDHVLDLRPSRVRTDLEEEATRIAFLIAGGNRVDDAATSLTRPILSELRQLTPLGRRVARNARSAHRELDRQQAELIAKIPTLDVSAASLGGDELITLHANLAASLHTQITDFYESQHRLVVLVRAYGFRARLRDTWRALRWLVTFWALKLSAFTLTSVATGQALHAISRDIGWWSIPASALVGAVVVQLGLTPVLRHVLRDVIGRHVQVLFGILAGLRYQHLMHVMAMEGTAWLVRPPMVSSPVPKVPS